MPSQGAHPGRLQARGTGPCDQDLLFPVKGRIDVVIPVSPDEGVDSASDGQHAARQAAQAGGTGSDVLHSTLYHLDGQLGVREQSPAHGDHVHLVLLERLLRVGEV